MKMMHLQTEEDQRFPANHQKAGMAHGTDPLSQPSEETNPANTLILYFQPPEPWNNKVLLFKPFSVWHFVKAALEN